MNNYLHRTKFLKKFISRTDEKLSDNFGRVYLEYQIFSRYSHFSPLFISNIFKVISPLHHDIRVGVPEESVHLVGG